MLDVIIAKKPHKIVSETNYVALYGSFARFTPTKLQEIVTGIAETWEGIRANTVLAGQLIQQAAIAKWEEIKAGILEKLRSLLEAMGLDFDVMVARWQTIWADVQLIAAAVWELIKTTISEKLLQVATFIYEQMMTVQAFWTATWTLIKSILLMMAQN